MCMIADMGPCEKVLWTVTNWELLSYATTGTAPSLQRPQHGPAPVTSRLFHVHWLAPFPPQPPLPSLQVNFRCMESRDRIREVAGSGRSSSVLNEKRFTAAVAAGAGPVSSSELPPPRGELAVSFSPETRGPGSGGLIGGAVRSSPPGDPAHPALLRGCVLPDCCHPEEETAQRVGR